ncbi:SH3 domain-containing protein [Roseibium hamelinense]|uniref:SH3 domain-containing protein n=1 Tax=Roseibium hamelinense TaxID=150831 RepID=UPI0011A2DC00|nr:SH3 domain-containing protein [Roseibium hamelinense]MTI43768.1 SH3 domain-containing protein [Roseibium hamelinense]
MSLKIVGAATAIALTVTGSALYAAHDMSEQAPAPFEIPETLIAASRSTADASPIPPIADRFSFVERAQNSDLKIQVEQRLAQTFFQADQTGAQIEVTGSAAAPPETDEDLRAGLDAQETQPELAYAQTSGESEDGIAAIVAATENEASVSAAEQADQAGNTPDIGAQASDAVITAAVNMRAAASNKSKILAVLPPQATVRVGSCDSWWCSVSYDGKTGYISKRFVSRQG